MCIFTIDHLPLTYKLLITNIAPPDVESLLAALPSRKSYAEGASPLSNGRRHESLSRSLARTPVSDHHPADDDDDDDPGLSKAATEETYPTLILSTPAPMESSKSRAGQ